MKTQYPQEAFKEEFKGLQSVLLNTASLPAKMTTAQAYKAARSVESKTTATARKAEEKVQPFKTTSPFHDYFGEDWNMIWRMVFDPGHEFSNLGIDLLALINDKDKMKWTEGRKMNHKKFKRFRVNGYVYILAVHDDDILW
jgi:hypothetical protein